MSTKVLIVSHYNLANLKTILTKNSASQEIEFIEAPFGQAEQLALQSEHEIWSSDYLAIIVWFAPERVSESYGRAAAGGSYDAAELAKDMQNHLQVLQRFRDKCGAIFHASFVNSRPMRGGGPVGMTRGTGCKAALLEMNYLLVTHFSSLSLGYTLDASKWIESSATSRYSEKLWYFTKNPFSNETLKLAANDISSAVRLLRGCAKKLIVVDLDNTIWGGILGEDGVAGLRLGGLDPIGEAFQDFQHLLKALKRHGFLLAILSKNDEGIALEAIRTHPEMVLREQDFAAWRINWDDKASNLISLVQELNLGLDSVVFLDDSPFERERVAEACPEVSVLELSDPFSYRLQLDSLVELDRLSITDEDRTRSELYASERERRIQRTEIAGLEDWIRSLCLEITIDPVTSGNLRRVVQLLNKTNQMNLAGRRMPEAEFQKWLNFDANYSWAVRVTDKFGDYGLSGVVSLTHKGDAAQIVDFCLSCRVLGRRVEHDLLSFIGTYARQSLNATILEAEYIPTDRNRACLEFLEQSGAKSAPNSTLFHYDLQTKTMTTHNCSEIKISEPLAPGKKC